MKNKKFQNPICFFIFLLIFNSMTAQDNNKDNQVLNSHQQSMASIASLTATGNLEQLKPALHTGLDAGLTINEIKEALVQLYAYRGFPRSLNAINTLMAVVEERKSQGKKDIEGKDASAVSITDKYKSGKEETDPKTGAADFAPAVDTFLKEHLFADIFNRDVLNFRQREFVTISALAAMPGVEPQLQAHLTMGKNTGITDAQLLELTTIIEKTSGKTQANVLRNTIGQPVVPIIEPDMLVRISEIEIIPEYLEEYKTILEKESSEAVKLEAGVIAIYPMFQKENPLQIRIIEIYANQKAYKSHLQTPHFQHYKTTTLKMVKSLKLVDMTALDPNTMPLIFDKIGK